MFLRYNYDIDIACKLEYDGTGGKLVYRVAIEREYTELLRILANIGFVMSYSVQSPGGGTSSSSSGDSATQRLIAEVCKVRPLKSLARRLIRKKLGSGIQRKASVLPLPASMKEFVLAIDVLGEHQQTL